VPFSSLSMDENCTGEDEVDGLGVAEGAGRGDDDAVVGGREEGEDVPLLSAGTAATDAATGADGGIAVGC